MANPAPSVDSFWRTIPRRSLFLFLLGVFCFFSTIGSAVDIIHLGQQPLRQYVVSVLLFGGFAVLYAISGSILREKMWKVLLPLIVVQMFLISWLLPNRPSPQQFDAPETQRLHQRLVLAGSATMGGMILGYVCFIVVFISEGRRYFGVHREMVLASEIHHALVPDLSTRIGNFKFYGRSVPSGQVGGDLIDVFQNDREWIAYIADVSGHGVAPGVLMGMVKSAARMQLSSGEPSNALIQRLNSVLLPIKKPEMFITFAFLAASGDRLDYSTAGHPAILHHRASRDEIVELSCENFPLGMFEQRSFAGSCVDPEPNDVFLMVTDGALEVSNNKGEEFGLDGIKRVLLRQAGQPLPSIAQAVFDDLSRFGHGTDDVSLLLVRRVA